MLSGLSGLGFMPLEQKRMQMSGLAQAFDQAANASQPGDLVTNGDMAVPPENATMELVQVLGQRAQEAPGRAVMLAAGSSIGAAIPGLLIGGIASKSWQGAMTGALAAVAINQLFWGTTYLLGRAYAPGAVVGLAGIGLGVWAGMRWNKTTPARVK